MKKRRSFKKRLITFIGIILFSLWIGLGAYFVIYKFNVEEVATDKIKKTAPKVEEPVVTDVSLVMVGDALLHAAVYKAAKTSDSYDFSNMFMYMDDLIPRYDLAFYNQEAILGGTEIGLSTYPCFNAPQEFGDDMIDLGFNLVSRANNHTLDRGEKAILAAETYWSKQKDILTAGSYISEEARTALKVKELNDISYTVLSYTTLTNGLKTPEDKEYYVDLYDSEKVKADIERVRDEVDILMVSMHWGTEYTFTPTAQEYEIAQYLSSLGVDIIIGHHPHVVQPVQYVGDTLVIYSLGNFISSQKDLKKKIGLMVSLNIEKTEFKGETTIEIGDIKGTLLYNPNTSKYGRYIIYPFNEVDSSILTNYENIYNEYSGYVKVDDTITMNGLKGQSE